MEGSYDVEWEVAESFEVEMRYIHALEVVNPVGCFRLLRLMDRDAVYTDCFVLFERWARSFSVSGTAETVGEYFLGMTAEHLVEVRPESPISMVEAPKGASGVLWREFRNNRVFEAITRIWHAVSLGMELTFEQSARHRALRAAHLEEAARVREVRNMNRYQYVESKTRGFDKSTRDYFHRKMRELVMEFYNAQIFSADELRERFDRLVLNFVSVSVVEPDKEADNKKGGGS